MAPIIKKLWAKHRAKRLYASKSEPTASGFSNLLAKRKGRALEFKTGIKRLAIVGAVAGFTVAAARNPSFRTGVAIIGAFGAGAATLRGAATFAEHAGYVRRATHLVGKGLAEEAKKNEQLRDFLGKWRFVVVDKEGNIKGTNRKRFLGIGRLRLESNKIFAGKY